ncbi:MAG: FHA domain-containing protein [Archangium sp.]|nr:FHA domain-containing protein [Archangium sp.]
MSDSKPVSMPPHLWEALDLMSAEMGVPPDALVGQAVFMLARLNGYVVAGKAMNGGGPAAASPRAAAPAAPPRAQPPGMKARAQPPPPEPEPEPELPSEDEGNPFDAQPEQNFDDPPPEENYDPEPEPEPEPEPAPPPPRAGGGKQSLTLIVAGRDPFKMTGDVFSIGRGKSCEFVIDSNRVSREHVRITREGSDFVLEDLNSSNGTFFGPSKEKISKRKIKDGDEFTLGTEKIKFQIRK